MDYETYKQAREEFNTPEYKKYLKAVKGCKCLFCGATKGIEYHHIVPLSQGGDNRLNNIVPLCTACHIKAHGKKAISGKTYSRKGRKRSKIPDNIGEIMEKFFSKEITTQQAIDKSGLSKSVFYTLKSEYQRDHGIEYFHNNKGCAGNGKHNHTI